MCSNSTNHQINIDFYIHRLSYMKLKVTTNQKPKVDRKKKNLIMTPKKVIMHTAREQEKNKESEKNNKNNQ